MEFELPLIVFPDDFGMVKLAPEESIPDSVLRASMYFVARTRNELSIVAPLDALGSDWPETDRYRLLGIALVFGTYESGILKAVADPLAAAGVWILALGTHDTDYLLLRHDQFERAVSALQTAGHRVSGP